MSSPSPGLVTIDTLAKKFGLAKHIGGKSIPQEAIEFLHGKDEAELKAVLSSGGDLGKSYMLFISQCANHTDRTKALFNLYRKLGKKADKVQEAWPADGIIDSSTVICALLDPDVQRLKSFMTERPFGFADLLKILIDVGAGRQWLIKAICWAMERLDVDYPAPNPQARQQRLGGINADTAKAIGIIAARYSANAGFGGIVTWGPGNSMPQNVAANIRGHFKKHVLAISDKAEPVLTSESAWWWKKFAIKLKLDELDAADRDGVKDMFPQGVLAEASIEALLKADILKKAPLTVDRLINDFEKQYEQLAITSSKNLTDAAVQVAEKKVLISGACGSLYIIGRLDDSDVMGISSCYMVENMNDKLDPRKKVLLWHFT